MVAPELDDQWLELEKSFGGRNTLKGTAEEIIEQYNGLVAALAPQMPAPSPNVETKDTGADGIPVRVYTPKNASGSLPVGVYTHGGGYIMGNLDGEDPLCRAVAEFTPCVVVSVDYRLGPAFKMPVMLEDTMTAYHWAQKNAASFGGDPNKMFSIGGSAGGGLALSVANQFAKKGDKSSIKGTVAIVPASCHWDNVPEKYKHLYKSYEENKGPDVPVIDKSSMDTFYKAVDAKPDDSDVFVANSPHHQNFPPTYFATCGADPLRDDGTITEAALRDAGVQTKLDHYPGFPHYFWIFPGFPPGEKFVNNLIGGVKWVVSQMA